MWECGLKPSQVVTRNGKAVSLLMWECGLKLETPQVIQELILSLLMWECGLKHLRIRGWQCIDRVTPYVGVWIETQKQVCPVVQREVTPYVGVWIETIPIRCRHLNR